MSGMSTQPGCHQNGRARANLKNGGAAAFGLVAPVPAFSRLAAAVGAETADIFPEAGWAVVAKPLVERTTQPETVAQGARVAAA